jgi:hypothetical protein
VHLDEGATAHGGVIWPRGPESPGNLGLGGLSVAGKTAPIFDRRGARSLLQVEPAPMLAQESLRLQL